MIADSKNNPVSQTNSILEEKDQSEKLDWVSAPGKFFVTWGIPILALIMSGTVFPEFNMLVWPVALSWMGMGCLLNASRCRRLHCFYTGPFFLIMALVSIIHGWDIFSLSIDGWKWIGWITLIGGLGLTFLTEWIGGKYLGPTCR
ncbi:MAG: hypothetical protein ACE5EK_04465 [Nitrospinales bacterium]